MSTPGVIGIVGLGRTPHPVAEDELLAIRRVLHEGVACEPWPFLREGQRVRVTGGSLDGVEGLLLSIRKQSHLVLQIGLLQRSVLVHIERHRVRPVL